MILIIKREIYPAAEPDALVDIVPVDVAVPLDPVLINNETLGRRRSSPTPVSSRAACGHSPKT